MDAKKPVPVVFNVKKSVEQLLQERLEELHEDVPPVVKRIASGGGLELVFTVAPKIYVNKPKSVNLAKKLQRAVTKEGLLKKVIAKKYGGRRPHPKKRRELGSLSATGMVTIIQLNDFLKTCYDEEALLDMLLRELATDLRYTHVYRIFGRYNRLRTRREHIELQELVSSLIRERYKDGDA